MIWNTDMVYDRVHEAFQTFARLPADMPAGYSGSMPEHLQEAREVFAIAVDEGGYRPMTSVQERGGPPTGEMIDRADEVIDWCFDANLQPGSASWICLWGACAGHGSGPKICKRLNISPSTRKRYRRKALATLAEYLNSGSSTPTPPIKTFHLTHTAQKT